MVTSLRALGMALAISLSVALLTTLAHSQTHPQSYRMECRGGGTMFANYYPGKTTVLEIHFDKAKRAAGLAAPGPGECAWVDRPINDAEPFWLNWRFPQEKRRVERITFGAASGVPGVSIPANTSSKYVSAVIMEIDDRKLRGLVDAIHRGKAFTVECYKEESQFVVTQVAP